ncbi:MAG: nucleotidyltransferase domain-containing protein [Anaerolineales bacterium]|nr:nucleotidyltransferase domain-containing protein [Anaerolineales bacterium]
MEVLKLFFLRSSGRHYVREIASLTDQPVRAVQRELARLEEGGLLVSELDGNRKYYQANRNSPVFSDLRAILVKTVGLTEEVRNQLKDRSDEIDMAFVFGSFARGEEGSQSDVDILVIGSISSRALSGLLSPLKEELGREMNPVVLPRAEFQQKIENSDAFILSVMREPKFFLIGGEDELEALAG